MNVCICLLSSNTSYIPYFVMVDVFAFFTYPFRRWFLQFPCSRAIMLAISTQKLLWWLLIIDQVTCFLSDSSHSRLLVLWATAAQTSSATSLWQRKSCLCGSSCLRRAACTSLCAAYPRAAGATGHQVVPFKTTCPVDQQEYLWCAFCRRADKKVKGGKNKREDR